MNKVPSNQDVCQQYPSLTSAIPCSLCNGRVKEKRWEGGGRKKKPILGLHGNSQVTLSPTHSAESDKLKDGRGGKGLKKIPQTDLEGDGSEICVPGIQTTHLH